MITERTYTQSSKSWKPSVWKVGDREDAIDEVRITIHTAGDGDWYGDFGFIWYHLGRDTVGIKLMVFDDSWKAMLTLAPLLESLDNPNGAPTPTPEQFCKLLEDMGFVPSEHHGHLVDPELASAQRRRALR